MTHHYEISSAAVQAAEAAKVRDSAGSTFIVTRDEQGRPSAMVQPGRGVKSYVNPITGDATATVPVETPSSYARDFGRTPTPEWKIFGKLYATYVYVERVNGPSSAEPAYRVRSNSFDEITPAAHAALTAWLTSPAMLAELFTPAHLAQAAFDSAAQAAHYAEADYATALAARDAARARLDAAARDLAAV